MYRVISFIVIFLFVAALLFLHNQNSHYTSGHTEGHTYETVEIPAGEEIPSIDGSVHQDHSGSWFVRIETDNFSFAPEKVGLEETNYKEGHAHLYINGEKVNRMYGDYYNLDYLDKGRNTVKVSLHANNHGIYMYAGEEIAFENEFHVE
ncbi:hypothetical protein QGM71_10500 [Virgibacillus sp. C22-A2]|uniref:Uncharacterized protein n=1 Tax=Virgibacillus tibetensis TaxID=3042313 RepID=A0ABU6KHL0_9BACI|nr:hypothetical protein [Virgibacillus sp. C22-A2]